MLFRVPAALSSPAEDWRAIDPRHTQMASFRAIEQGFNLARQTNQGWSAAYDYEGHQLAHMDQYQAQELTLVAQVPTRGVIRPTAVKLGISRRIGRHMFP